MRRIDNPVTKGLALALATILPALAAAALAFNFLPVNMTVFESPQDPDLSPYGEILPGGALTRCASDISDYGKYGEIRVSLLLATYNRLNTAHCAMQVFVFENGRKNILLEEIFSAAEVADNKYRTFAVEPAATMPGRLCFSLSSADSAPGNAITVWLNSAQDPVFKITAAATLPDLLTRLGNRGLFGLGREALFGLFFACLAVQIWLIVYVAGTILGRAKHGGKNRERNNHEREKIPKPSHRKRTG